MKQKRNRNLKIYEQVKKSLYNWIIFQPQVVQPPIANHCLKMKIDGYTKPQLVPKLLLHVSVREINNNIVSVIKDDGLREARDEDDNIIISDSILRSLFPIQFKNAGKIQGHVWS